MKRLVKSHSFDKPDQVVDIPVGKYIAQAVAVLIGLVLILVLCAGGCKEYKRYQARADRQNAVKVTEIEVKRAEQQARINRAQIAATIAEAEKRFEEAKGIKKAQEEINKTLTPLYVQHEAIQKLPAARAVYIPSGPQGIPQVYNVAPTIGGD